MLISLSWIFMKLGFLYRDISAIEEYLHRELVTKHKFMSEEEFSEVHSIGKISMISYKLTYAFSVGTKIQNIFVGLLLALLTLLPIIVMYGLVLFWLFEKADSVWLWNITEGVAPVLAAYFLYSAFTYLRKGFRNFAFVPFVLICLQGFILVFILRWPIVLTLVASLLFFLCFMKGGNING